MKWLRIWIWSLRKANHIIREIGALSHSDIYWPGLWKAMEGVEFKHVDWTVFLSVLLIYWNYNKTLEHGKWIGFTNWYFSACCHAWKGRRIMTSMWGREHSWKPTHTLNFQPSSPVHPRCYPPSDTISPQIGVDSFGWPLVLQSKVNKKLYCSNFCLLRFPFTVILQIYPYKWL